MIPTACSDLFKRMVDRWSRFVVRFHRWLIPTIVIAIAFGGWAFGTGIEIDYGINAFKVRDHPSAANLDSMNAAVVQYHELASDFRTQLKKLGLKKRSLVDNEEHDWRDRVYSASELVSHGYVDGLETPFASLDDAETFVDDEPVHLSRKRAKEEQRARNQWHLHVILEVPDDTVFRADVLHFAKDLQTKITELPRYDDFCWVPTTARGFCSPPESLLPIFYPTRVNEGDSADSRPLGSQLTDIESGVNTVLRYGIYYYTDKQFNSTNKRSTLFRIQFQFGSPLPGFDNYRDRYTEQEELFGSWAMMNLHPLLRSLDVAAVPGLRVFYGGDGLTEREILATLVSDASFASFSLLCIFGLLWLNTESLFVALVSTFEIAVSVPFVYWMYRVVGGIRYLGVLNAISLFLILGIGVDDCLIFYNTFMQLAHLPDLGERLSITYRRATKATFITSFTTAAAFAVNLNSAIPALRLFAIFMSLLVVANWILVVTWFPATLIFWHESARHWRCFDSCLRGLRLRRAAPAAESDSVRLVGADGVEEAEGGGDLEPSSAVDLEPAPTLKSAGDNVLRKRIANAGMCALAGACALGIVVGIVGSSDVALVTSAVCGAIAGVLGSLAWAYVPQKVRSTVRTLHQTHILDAALYGLLVGTLIGYIVLAEVWSAALAGVAIGALFTGLAALRHRTGPNSRLRNLALALLDYENDEALPAHYRNSEKFFHQHFAPFIVRWRVVLLLTFTCLLVASAWRTTYLHPSEDLPQFFSRTSNLQRFIDWRVGGYYKDGSYSVSQLPVKYGCDKIADSGKVVDVCGVCGGDCTTCVASCDGVGNRTCDKLVKPDACLVCGGDNATCGMGMTTTSVATMMSITTTPSTDTTIPTWDTTTRTTMPISPPTTSSTTTTTTTTATTTTTTTATTSSTDGSTTMCVRDVCGVCGGSNLCAGCDGNPNSGKTYDSCGVCGGTDECIGCDGEINSGKKDDACGVCGGNNSTCTDCRGVLRGSSSLDRCGVCDGDGTTCAGTPAPSPMGTQPPTPVPTGCDGIPESPKRKDMCGVCGGRNACVDCDGVPYGTRAVDACGVCGGDGQSCRGGCDGMGHTVDKCGVCGGGNACLGCDGSFNVTKKYDACGVCDGTNACLPIKPISANLNSLYVTWGLEGIDRSKADINNPFDSYLGDPIYDEEFEFEDPLAQLAVENLTNTLVEDSNLVEQGHERNFFPQLRSWLRDVQHMQFPISRAYNASIVLARFIYANPTFDSYIGFRVYPLRVSFVRVRVLSKVDSGWSSATAAEHWDAFQEVLDKANRAAPPTARSAEQASDIWIRVFTEVVAVNGIRNGVILTGVVSVVCLTFFTGNVLVSLLAVLSIGGNLVVMLALYALWGWTLGAIEAISVSILVGLSVDYCFHLAEAYAISRKQTRVARVVDAMTHMGISVIGGAMTTAASALFLLFCQIEIFHKFGVIVVVNTFFSVVFTFFFFCALLATIGPTGHWGDIGYAVRWVRNQFNSAFNRPAAYQTVWVANDDADGGLMDTGRQASLTSSKPPVLPVVVLQ